MDTVQHGPASAPRTKQFVQLKHGKHQVQGIPGCPEAFFLFHRPLVVALRVAAASCVYCRRDLARGAGDQSVSGVEVGQAVDFAVWF